MPYNTENLHNDRAVSSAWLERLPYKQLLYNSPLREPAEILAQHPVTELFCSYKGHSVSVKIDTADLPKVLSFTRRGVTYYMHRILTDAPAGMEVDHENHDSLDNRRSTNLRVVTHQQNLNNRVDHRGLRCV